MITREECVKRFGAIDFTSGHWPDQSKWMTMLEIPSTWFPGWMVMNTAIRVTHIYCNKNFKEALFEALDLIQRRKLGETLTTFDGCFEVRMTRGSNNDFSAHSYGLAIDINALKNPLGATQGGFFDLPAVVDCFTSQGIAWGGDFSHRKDAMHFSWTSF